MKESVQVRNEVADFLCLFVCVKGVLVEYESVVQSLLQKKFFRCCTCTNSLILILILWFFLSNYIKYNICIILLIVCLYAVFYSE